jgi:hypothetical protein
MPGLSTQEWKRKKKYKIDKYLFEFYWIIIKKFFLLFLLLSSSPTEVFHPYMKMLSERKTMLIAPTHSHSPNR